MRRIFHSHHGMPTLVLWLSYVLTVSHALAAAPITPSGLNTQVSQPLTLSNGQTQYNITGGTRPGGGTNLFHSFGDFNVPNNNIANFLNDAGLATSNILGRVTDGNPSNIFGTIQTTGFGSANLFLMNPAGIVFGPNATLNVGGSVTFSTANYLRLADNALFNAIPNATADALLSTAPVAAFGFLGSNPGTIDVQGSQLSVAPGQSISLVGGNITVQSGVLDDGITIQPARISAPSGQINLASVASPGDVLAGTLAAAPNINGQSFGALGSIQISQQSVLDVSGNGGGTVLIRGGSFVLDNSTISAKVTGPGPVTDGVESTGGGVDIVVSQDATIQNGAVIDTSVTGNATPGITYGGVHIKANNIEIFGSQDIVNFPVTGVFSNVAKDSTGGNSGDISLEGNSILMRDFGGASITFLQTSTNGAGNAGNISLTSKGDLQIDNGQIKSSSEGSSSSPASGNAGNITLISTEGNISMTDTSQVAGTFVASSTIGLNTSGRVGNITVSAPAGDILVSDFASIFTHIDGTGNNTGRGGVQFTANNLTIQGSSGIQIDNFTPFQPGNLSVNVTGRLRVSSTDPIFQSSLLTITRTLAQAAAVNVTSHDTVLSGNVLVSTETRSSGPGGPLNIFTQTLQVTDGAQITSGTKIGSSGIPSGNGGAITIQGLTGPADSVLIDGPSSGIFTNTVGTGAGGNINITAHSLTLQNGGTLSAATSGTASSARGGSITVNATNQVTMTGGASITSSSTGPADAGNIFINAGQQLQMQNSSITTTASQASGGNIEIQAIDQVRLVNSTISTSVLGGSGSGGNITIDPNSVILQNSQIIAQAIQGAGGNITIVTPLFLADQTSIVDASSEFGLSGTVNIQNPTSNLAGSVASLPSSLRQVQSLQTGRCAALYGETSSSFVVAGRETIPTEPGGWEVSPMASLNTGSGLAVRGDGQEMAISAHVPEDQEVVSLRRLTPAGFLTQHFAENPATGCHS